jgi:uridylate kinase
MGTIGRSTVLKIVVRLGGSILGTPIDPDIVKRYADVISKVLEQKHKVVVIVGGGATARQYIETARKIGLSHKAQDLIAIQASRLNARLVGMALGSDDVAVTLREVISRVEKDRIAVMGGLRPGITTDTVATLVAEAWKSDLIVKASDQDGIYEADPRSHPEAKLLRTVSYDTLVDILGGKHSPGIHMIVDPVAVQHITKNKLRLIVVNGTKPKNIISAVNGEKVGTTVG